MKTVLKFVVIGFVLGLISFLLLFQFGLGLPDATHMLLSYLFMFLLTIVIYLGLKHYKKIHREIPFNTAIGLGLFIALFIGIGVGLADYIFTAFIKPDFIEQYISCTLQTMSKTLSPEEFKIKEAEFNEQMRVFGSSFMMAVFMVFNVLTIGFVTSILYGIILKRS